MEDVSSHRCSSRVLGDLKTLRSTTPELCGGILGTLSGDTLVQIWHGSIQMIVVVETDFPSTFLPWTFHGFVPSDRASASREKWTGASIQWNSAQILPCFFGTGCMTLNCIFWLRCLNWPTFAEYFLLMSSFFFTLFLQCPLQDAHYL